MHSEKIIGKFDVNYGKFVDTWTPKQNYLTANANSPIFLEVIKYVKIGEFVPTFRQFL